MGEGQSFGIAVIDHVLSPVFPSINFCDANKFFEDDTFRSNVFGLKECRSAAVDSIEQSIVFYKNAAPLERKGRTTKQLNECILYQSPPRRCEIIVESYVFCIRAPAGRNYYRIV